MKRVLLYMLLPLLLSAYSDNDLDGVEDKYDLCPNTTLIEIVDDSGCTIERLVDTRENNSSTYDIIFGVGYSKNSSNSRDTETLSETLQVDYSYKKFSLQLQSSHFKLSSNSYNQSGMSDTYLGTYYNLKLSKKLSMNLGARLNIPTYKSDLDNNNLDYTLSSSFNYRVNKFTMLFGVGYTFINDDDINSTTYSLNYQNSLNYHMGVGYFFTPKLYTNLSYINSQSIYIGEDDISSASFYGHYTIDTNWFTTLSYSKGLSDGATDSSISVRVGYYF